VIDTETDQVVAEIPAGKKPRGTVVTPDARTAFVTDQPAGALNVVDLVAGKLVGSIPLGTSPEGAGISADGRWVAAAVEEGNEVMFIDTATRQKVFDVKVKGRNPEHAVFSPDGKTVIVSAEEGEAVDVIDFASRSEVAQIPVGARPAAWASRPMGSSPGWRPRRPARSTRSTPPAGRSSAR
jgi:YVTN family beta-propeller protein